MSVKVMSAVWEHSRAKGGALLVLLAIADHADDNGIAWPGLKLLARKARMTTRNVQFVIRTLIKTGELRVSPPGQHPSNTYKVLLRRKASKGEQIQGDENFSPRKDFVGGTKKVQGGGEAHFVGGAKPTSSEPSLNHHIEPPVRESAGSAPAPPTPLSVFEAAFDFLPNKQQQTAIIQAITDTAKWKYVLDQWALAGHWAKNVKGQLDWYRNGVPQYEPAKERKRRSPKGGRGKSSGLFYHPPDERDPNRPRLKPYA